MTRIRRWPFSDGFEDAVTTNDASAESGSPVMGTVAGRRCARFDGDDALVIERGANEELSVVERGDPAFSIGGWVYFDGLKTEGEESQHTVYRDTKELTVKGTPLHSEGVVELKLSVASWEDAPGYDSVKDADSGQTQWVQPREWHHFLYVVHPGSSVAFYLDGERQFEDESASGVSPNRTEYWATESIGGWHGGNPAQWHDRLVGSIADLRLYGTGLSESQVTQLYVNSVLQGE